MSSYVVLDCMCACMVLWNMHKACSMLVWQHLAPASMAFVLDLWLNVWLVSLFLLLILCFYVLSDFLLYSSVPLCQDHNTSMSYLLYHVQFMYISCLCIFIFILYIPLSVFIFNRTFKICFIYLHRENSGYLIISWLTCAPIISDHQYITIKNLFCFCFVSLIHVGIFYINYVGISLSLKYGFYIFLFRIWL